MDKKFYFIGDIHGDFRTVRDFYQRNPRIASDKSQRYIESTLICLGDFGGNYFDNYRDDDFKKKLGRYPFTYFVIRGNHEDRAENRAAKYPDAWTTEEYFGNTVWVEKAYPYIKYALDVPAVYHIPYVEKYSIELDENEHGELPDDIVRDLDVLVLPGAYSVDKLHRLANGYSWFPQEQLSEEEQQIGVDLCEQYNYRFDMVLSHTCPICFEPTDLFLSFIDQSQVDKTMERYLGGLEFKMSYDRWLWGHYHADRVYPTGHQIMLFKQAVELQNLMDNCEEINFM